MKTSERVEVTFVGGPRHGDREMIELPHGRRLAVVQEGITTLYEAHTWAGQDAEDVACTQAIFCPVGMPEEEYRRLLLAIPAPPGEWPPSRH